MSSEEQFGQAGIESSQGSVPMETPPEPSESSDISSSRDSLREQASELTERRESNANREDPPDIISSGQRNRQADGSGARRKA